MMKKLNVIQSLKVYAISPPSEPTSVIKLVRSPVLVLQSPMFDRLNGSSLCEIEPLDLNENENTNSSNIGGSSSNNNSSVKKMKSNNSPSAKTDYSPSMLLFSNNEYSNCDSNDKSPPSSTSNNKNSTRLLLPPKFGFQQFERLSNNTSTSTHYQIAVGLSRLWVMKGMLYVYKK